MLLVLIYFSVGLVLFMRWTRAEEATSPDSPPWSLAALIYTLLWPVAVLVGLMESNPDA